MCKLPGGYLNLHSSHTVYLLIISNNMSISKIFLEQTATLSQMYPPFPFDNSGKFESVSFTHETGANWILYPEFPFYTLCQAHKPQSVGDFIPHLFNSIPAKQSVIRM